jgi:hypothetical protein
VDKAEASCIFDGGPEGQFQQLILDGLHRMPCYIHAFEPSQHAFKSLGLLPTGWGNFRIILDLLNRQISLVLRPLFYTIFTHSIGRRAKNQIRIIFVTEGAGVKETMIGLALLSLTVRCEDCQRLPGGRSQRENYRRPTAGQHADFDSL